MKGKLVALVSILLVLGILGACKGTAAEVTTPVTLPSGPPDVVNLNYFYESDACFCLHLAGEWINTTVNTDYKAQLDSGALTYNEWDTKDSASGAKMAEFDATNYAFFITEVKSGEKATHSVNGLWLYTDSSGTNELLKSKFITLLKKEIDKALAGG
jgi:hypothetical protein